MVENELYSGGNDLPMMCGTWDGCRRETHGQALRRRGTRQRKGNETTGKWRENAGGIRAVTTPEGNGKERDGKPAGGGRNAKSGQRMEKAKSG